MTGSIADIRKNYSQKNLSEKDAAINPIQQFSKWWEEAGQDLFNKELWDLSVLQSISLKRVPLFIGVLIAGLQIFRVAGQHLRLLSGVGL